MSEPAADEQDSAAAFTRFDCSDADQLGPAADASRRAIEAGECVVLPTDTVYGIGADAFSSAAVQRLLDAKGRGRDMPPPVLIGDPSAIKALSSDVPENAHRLIEAFWPGALTVIVRARSSLQMDLGETDGTVALRVPNHELTRRLLRQTGPLAVSSANRSGRPAALSCDQAIDQLGDRVSVYLDGGRLGEDGAPPSSIVDFSRSDDGELLRLGALSLEQLREHCPDLVDRTSEPRPSKESGTPAEPVEVQHDPSHAEPVEAQHDPSRAEPVEAQHDPSPGSGSEGVGSGALSRARRFTLQPPKAAAGS